MEVWNIRIEESDSDKTPHSLSLKNNPMPSRKWWRTHMGSFPGNESISGRRWSVGSSWNTEFLCFVTAEKVSCNGRWKERSYFVWPSTLIGGAHFRRSWLLPGGSHYQLIMLQNISSSSLSRTFYYLKWTSNPKGPKTYWFMTDILVDSKWAPFQWLWFDYAHLQCT